MCTQAVTQLIEYLMEVSKDGISLAQKCTPQAAARAQEVPDTVMVMEQTGRLYESEKDDGKKKNDMSILLGALLPVTAIVGFIGGRVYSNRRAQADQTREFLSDNEC